MVRLLTEDRVQIIVRTTSEEREQIKELAEKKNTSMNQFIIDAIFKNNDDSMNDSDSDSSDIILVNVLRQQLDKKDVQIKNLQNIIDQQQQLTLQSNKQIEHLQIELSNEGKETELNDNHTDLKKKANEERKETKQGFFSRLFNL